MASGAERTRFTPIQPADHGAQLKRTHTGRKSHAMFFSSMDKKRGKKLPPLCLEITLKAISFSLAVSRHGNEVASCDILSLTPRGRRKACSPAETEGNGAAPFSPLMPGREGVAQRGVCPWEPASAASGSCYDGDSGPSPGLTESEHGAIQLMLSPRAARSGPPGVRVVPTAKEPHLGQQPPSP